MSDKDKPQTSGNPNEWNNWIEETISKKLIKYFEYKDFRNKKIIGKGAFGEIYRANYKNWEQYLVLKSLFNLGNAAVKEVVHEVIQNIM